MCSPWKLISFPTASVALLEDFPHYVNLPNVFICVSVHIQLRIRSLLSNQTLYNAVISYVFITDFCRNSLPKLNHRHNKDIYEWVSPVFFYLRNCALYLLVFMVTQIAKKHLFRTLHNATFFPCVRMIT